MGIKTALGVGIKAAVATILVVSLLVLGLSATSVLSGYGDLVIKIKDPPNTWGQATAVYITSDDIYVHRADAGSESGWFATGISVANLNLGEITVFERAVGQTTLRAGSYNIIRFEIVEAIVTVEGKNYPCEVASGKLNVPILLGGVKVEPNTVSNLLIDITVVITGTDQEFKLVPSAIGRPV